jgi:hypothetical protein
MTSKNIDLYSWDILYIDLCMKLMNSKTKIYKIAVGAVGMSVCPTQN